MSSEQKSINKKRRETFHCLLASNHIVFADRERRIWFLPGHITLVKAADFASPHICSNHLGHMSSEDVELNGI